MVVLSLLIWQGALAGTPTASGPVSSLLGLNLALVTPGPEIRIEPDADGAGFSARFVPGDTSGRIRLGPVPVPGGAGVLKFTGALSLPADLTCRISVLFSAAGVASAPVTLAFSEHAARVGDVFQDLFIPVQPEADSVLLELHVTQAGNAGPTLRLRYPCLTAMSASAVQAPVEEVVVFRQSFSHPDGRADVVKDGASLYPVWSCVLPAAMGKAGPGLRAKRSQDAAFFSLPEQQELLSRGHLTFWLKPLWDQGDARPADMIKLTQGRSKVLVRKNHGWSFLLVVWDGDGKTRGVSCDLRTLTKGHWTKIEAVWAAEKGMRLIVNGVTLGKKDDSWSVSPKGAMTLRIGQGEHDTKEPAPYILDDIEILTRLPKEVFQQ